MDHQKLVEAISEAAHCRECFFRTLKAVREVEPTLAFNVKSLRWYCYAASLGPKEERRFLEDLEESQVEGKS